MSNLIRMPALSPTMEEGTLARWLVAEGDEVKAGDVIAEIETDKATMEVEADEDGQIARLLVAPGTDHVAVNQPIAELLGEDATPIERPSELVSASLPDAEAAGDVPPPKSPAASAPSPSNSNADLSTSETTPLAMRLLSHIPIDAKTLKGSGSHGQVTLSDVRKAAGVSAPVALPTAPATIKTAEAPAQPASDVTALFEEGSFEIAPHPSMRRTIAKRLTSAKRDIPHFYLTVDCALDGLLALRKELNARASVAEEPTKISVNDLIIKASGLALRQVPEANVSWTDDGMLQHAHADIAVAVAIEGGLITPIIRQAENKGLGTIASEMADLATRARERKLMPEEYQGGTFSISNLGMFGIDSFQAVINPPHAAILAVGQGKPRAVVREGALQTATLMTVTLSCDHRAIDGATGSAFLQAFKAYIEDPKSMML